VSKEPGAVHGYDFREGHPDKAFSARDAPDRDRPKARQWVDVAQIARREGKAERHVRLLAALAFLSPRIVAAIIDGTAPADLTATSLARALPYSWAEQESRLTGIMPMQENDVLLEPSMPVPT
jgi:hypothetical protein